MSEPTEPGVGLPEDDTRGEEIHPPAPGDDTAEPEDGEQ